MNELAQWTQQVTGGLGGLVPESMVISHGSVPECYTRPVWQSVLSKDSHSKISHPTSSSHSMTWTLLP